jgi:Amt family ammonium transporter
MGAVVSGLSAGVVCYWATQMIKRKFIIDDSLDVFPVHGVGGILGTLLAGIFASSELGLFSGQGLDVSIAAQLGVQLTAVIAAIVYTAVVTYILLKVSGLLTNGIRVSVDEETQGLDLSLHEESGYKL